MNAIVVADRSWAIGRDGGLLFSLPTDMKRFRSLTMGGTVILGRKTLESFPGGRPLPKRKNIVITRRKDLQVEGAVVVSSLAEALDAAGDTPPDQIWVIGGGSVYTALLERCKRVYLTKVDAQAEDPDTFFPNLDKLPGWEVEHESEPVEENGLTFRFVEYINQKI
ncbi:dihydrofolate reductase [uncultured Oscillibacter sp.]|uniref:dihydrofolate reductase n=1 Tax=uncultured Oscillibacter sp. TaxID=876091 RepID=UPI00280ACA84|nr:dihydrofolate reductase [uncultured Oscillibacter sp.]